MFSCQFFEGLKKILDQIPLVERSRYAFEYDRVEGDVLKCVEGSYRQATERLLNLFYYIEWAQTLSNNEQTRPDLPRQSPDRMGFLFHDIEGMTPKETGDTQFQILGLGYEHGCAGIQRIPAFLPYESL